MGIRALTKRLESYAVPVILHSSESNDETESGPRLAIIDGPALCYHILIICLSARGRRSSPYDDLPSYQELAETTICWLERLQRHGFVIRSVFFDGFLPWSKKDERVHRYQESTNGAFTLRARYSDASLGSLSSLPSTPIDIEVDVHAQGNLRLIAPTSFITAVLDRLSISEFAEATNVVPGEADIYCAEDARVGSAYIFTGDSDLLVHDIGPDSKVLFFKDLGFSTEEDMEQMTYVRYHPASIAAAHGLKDMLGLAYFAKQDHRRTISECVALVKVEVLSGPRWTDFVTPYLKKDRLPCLGDLAHVQELLTVFKYMDPRASELLLQLRFRSQEPARSRTLYVFVPELLDDPVRMTALLPTLSLRITIYNMLGLVDPSVAAISEYGRRGRTVCANPVFLRHGKEALQEIVNLTQWIQGRSSDYSVLPPVSRWRMIAANILCDVKAQQGSEKPSTPTLRALILNESQPTLTWALLHFKAELTGILHYLLFLAQILHFLGAVTGHVVLADAVHTALQAITEAVWTLPKIADLYDWSSCLPDLSEDARNLIEAELIRLTASHVEKGTRKRRLQQAPTVKNDMTADGDAVRRQQAVKGNAYGVLALLSDE